MRQIELLRYAVNALDRLEIPYVVVGSYASSAWGEPRMTRDIDIVIDLSPAKVDSICAAFPGDDFYVSAAAVSDALQHRTQFNVIHPMSGNKIDFMIAGIGDWPAEQLARRKKIDFDVDASAFVAAPEDVILGKLMYFREGGSEKHLRDIRGIIKVSGDVIDYDYLASTASRLGVQKVWLPLARECGIEPDAIN